MVRSAAELYAFDNDQEKLRQTIGGWGGDAVACELAQNSLDSADQQRLVAAATIVNGTGCGNLLAPVTGVLPGATAAVSGGATEESGSSLLPLLLLGLLLLLLLLAIFYVWNRRRELLDSGANEENVTYGESPASRKSARPS